LILYQQLITPISTTSHLLRSTTVYSFVQKWKERLLGASNPVEVNSFLSRHLRGRHPAMHEGRGRKPLPANQLARHERDLETRGQYTKLFSP